MFYQRIDLRKLYEQAEEPVSMDASTEDPGIVAGDISQAAEDFPTDEESASKEKVNIMKGNAYAFPVTQEYYNQLIELINAGSGEWMSPEPLKLLQSGRSGEAATMTVGGMDKPIYLMISLSQTKGDRKAKSLDLEKEDRIYVALQTSANELRNNLETASSIDNHTRLSVLTPIMKAGKNVEHTLEMWKDFKSDEDVVAEPQEDQAIASAENMGNVDIEAIKQNDPTLATQLDLPESRRRYIGGKWTRVYEAASYKMVRVEGGSEPNKRWIYDEANNKAYSVASPEEYNKLTAKFGVSAKAEVIDKSKLDSATIGAAESLLKEPAKAAPISVASFEDVLNKGTVLKVGRRGEAVKELQRFLKIEDDGIFGNATKSALVKWQEMNGLKADGIAGKNTITKIKAKQDEDPIIDGGELPTVDVIDTKPEAEKEIQKPVGVQAEVDTEAKADAEEEKKVEDMSADELKAEIEKAEKELEAAKGEVKQARKDRKANRKAEREEKKLQRKLERLQRRTERKEKRADRIEGNTSESKIYSFDEFVKSINGLQH